MVRQALAAPGRACAVASFAALLTACGGGGSTPTPTLVLTASAPSVNAQTPLELTWTSSNTTSCAASGAWSGSQRVSGNSSVTPSAAGVDNYTLVCAGPGGSVTQSVTVTVRPVVALSLSVSQVAVGASAALNWTSPGATGCTASGAWTGSLPAQGSSSVAPAAPGAYTYKLDCTSTTGDASQSATLTVTPSLLIASDQGGSPTIVFGQSLTIQWQSAGATACVASGAWSGAPSTSGSQPVTPTTTGTSTYSLTCSGNGTSITQGLAVLVNPAVTLSVAPTSVAPGNNAVLTWSSNGAKSCTASDAWNGSQPTSGSVTVTPRTLGGGGADPTLGPGSYLAYTLTCADGAGDSSLVRAFLRITPNGYSLTSLVADASGAALTADPDLVNPWGVAFPPGLPAVVANNASSTLTSYDGAGAVQSASIPAAVHLAPAGGGAAFARHWDRRQ